eukprot:SAG31_NODE_100_length_25264_cov_38.715359_8_plen_267_part_00
MQSVATTARCLNGCRSLNIVAWRRYRTYWLAAIPKSDAGRPQAEFLPDHTCHFSLPWGQVVAPYRDPTHTLGVEVLTDLSTVKLYQDGALVGNATVNSTALGWASIRWSPAGRNLTAVCQSDDASTTLQHTMLRPGNASAIVLTIDAPHPKTGTGTKLLLDGHDVALLRATVVDAHGTAVVDSTANVSFSVVSGPGRVIGKHMCLWQHNASSVKRAAVWYCTIMLVLLPELVRCLQVLIMETMHAMSLMWLPGILHLEASLGRSSK